MTIPYDQRIARILVRPLARIGITPNQITAFTLVLALAASWLFALGDTALANMAAGMFVLARFLDHFDGELARLTGKSSRFGYYFDYVTGGLSHAALFLGIGIGLANGPLGYWAIGLGLAGAASAIVSLFLNLDLDRRLEFTEGDTIGYPGLGGFELEDGIYLFAPITWIGWLPQFFVAAAVGAIVYTVWTFGRLIWLPQAQKTHDTQPDSGTGTAQAAAEFRHHENGETGSTDSSGQQ
ncbi:MAG: CDP-alcohol phosphatidyltransferase family protein [Alphaproteobacteria bacterium]